MKSLTQRSKVIWYLPLAIFLLAGATVSRADDNVEPRINATSQGQSISRGGLAGGEVSTDEFDALITSGIRQKPQRFSEQQKLSSSEARTPNTDFWFYDVDVQLFSDFDRDGYFYGIDLLFDADTFYAEADVYAVIYLSYENGPWNEYTMTEDFTLFGASADDEYVVETELLSGYPTGSYDILIDLYDTFDGAFVATIGPEDSSQLSLLPLEDANRDAPIVPDVIVVTSNGGGSLGWLSLLVLVGAAGFARRFKNRA